MNHHNVDGLSSAWRGSALVLVLDRPQRRNALTVGLVRAVADAIEQAPANGARAVVVTGSPPAFCAGGDLVELSTIAESGALTVAETIYSNFHRLVRAITGSPLPVIAAVNGAAVGAGLDLALACDLRIATREASFASSWVTVGLVPGMGGAHFLPRLVGGARAAQTLLLGTSLGAAKALEWGMVNEVVAVEALFERVDELVADLARLPEVAVARTKAALRRSLDAGLDVELTTLGSIQGTLLTAASFQEAAARFRR